jgi:hypothetical protein
MSETRPNPRIVWKHVPQEEEEEEEERSNPKAQIIPNPEEQTTPQPTHSLEALPPRRRRKKV